MKIKLPFVALMAAVSTLAFANFTPGNIAVFQADNVVNNTTFSILELLPSAGNQGTPVNTLPINGTSGPDALRTSGSASTTGYLSLNDSGTLLSFTGHNTTNASGNINATVKRGVGTLDAAGAFLLQTTYSGTAGNQTRSATSLDNATWWISDQGGLYTNDATMASPASNFRRIHAFGGSVYGSSASGTNIVVGTFSAPSGGTYDGLPGLTFDNTFTDFYMIQSGANGSSYDVLYTVGNTSATVGIIKKYSLVEGLWVFNGSYDTTFGGFGLAARKGGTGAELFVTTGAGGTAANSVMRLSDTAGYNATIVINTQDNLTLYTAPSGAVLKGVEFSPVSQTTDTEVAPGAYNVTRGVEQGSHDVSKLVSDDGSEAIVEQRFQPTPTLPNTELNASFSGATGTILGAKVTVVIRANSQPLGDASCRQEIGLKDVNTGQFVVIDSRKPTTSKSTIVLTLDSNQVAQFIKPDGTATAVVRVYHLRPLSPAWTMAVDKLTLTITR